MSRSSSPVADEFATPDGGHMEGDNDVSVGAVGGSQLVPRAMFVQAQADSASTITGATSISSFPTLAH